MASLFDRLLGAATEAKRDKHMPVSFYGCIATSYPTFEQDLQKIAHFQDPSLASLLGAGR